MGKKIGRQEPTVEICCPYRKSDGTKAAKLYGLSGFTLFKWQQQILKHILAMSGNVWTHSRVGLAISRRNGKTEIMYARVIWGVAHGEKILWTAHRVTTTHSSWERLDYLCRKIGFEITVSYKAFGREKLAIKDGGRVEFRTRTAKGGLGEGYDLVIYDEAQEVTDDQISALQYVVSASSNPQSIFIGTPPTASSSGTYFVKFRKDVTLKQAEHAYWAEWSVDEIHSPYDKEAWYNSNPSLGLLLSERAIQDEISGCDKLDFNIQRLGYWVKYNLQSDITLNTWERLKAVEPPKLKGKLSIGVKYSKTGTTVAVGVACHTADGKIFVEAIDDRSPREGTDWIVSFVKSVAAEQIIIDGASGQRILMDAMTDAGIRKNRISLPTVKDVISANAEWDAMVHSDEIRHGGQPSLTQSCTNVEKRSIGSAGGYGYRSIKDGVDVSLMDSVILASWACKSKKPARTQRISY